MTKLKFLAREREALKVTFFFLSLLLLSTLVKISLFSLFSLLSIYFSKLASNFNNNWWYLAVGNVNFWCFLACEREALKVTFFFSCPLVKISYIYGFYWTSHFHDVRVYCLFHQINVALIVHFLKSTGDGWVWKWLSDIKSYL